MLLRSLNSPRAALRAAPLYNSVSLRQFHTRHGEIHHRFQSTTRIPLQHRTTLRSMSMFGGISDKMKNVLGDLTARKSLSRDDVEEAMEQVRVALIEADVALPVVQTFVNEITEAAIGEKVIRAQGLPRAATVFEIVQRKLTELLGSTEATLNLPERTPPSANVILVMGIQGSGKTTTCGKLALKLSALEKKKVLLASIDTYRPAAQEQLARLAEQCVQNNSSVTIDSLPIIPGQQPLDIARRAMEEAQRGGYDVLICDSAGRMHIDEELMNEISAVRDILTPDESLLVADAMLGNEAVNIARQFHEKVGVSGIVLSRMDGDSRGGAAISMRKITGVPIKFVGVGERLEDLDKFVPSGIASRILGRGDIGALAEKARLAVQETEEQQMMKRGIKDLNDYLNYVVMMQKMGSFKNVMSYIPGMSSMADQIAAKAPSPETFKKHEAILRLLTPTELSKPLLFKNASARKLQIAKELGIEVIEVNQMLKFYEQIQKQFAAMKSAVGNDPSKFPKTMGELMNNPLVQKLIPKKKIVVRGK